MPSSPIPRPLADLVRDGRRCVFVSPHLDDAVLSCGALMTVLAQHCDVLVATVFTESGPAPHTRAARAFLRQCAAPDADGLFAARRSEDAAVLTGIGVRHEHLGLADALFRTRRHAETGPWRHVPELVHRYPTFRFDIARGRVSRGDRGVVDEIAERAAALADADGPVFFPLGVGRHVDHLLARGAGEHLAARAVYYADFPYSQSHPVDQDFVRQHRLLPARWTTGIAAKDALIRGYATQVDALFPDTVIPRSDETYYLA